MFQVSLPEVGDDNAGAFYRLGVARHQRLAKAAAESANESRSSEEANLEMALTLTLSLNCDLPQTQVI